MAVDIELTEDFETFWDQTGDIATTNGTEQIAQNISIRLEEEVDLTAPSPTAEAITEQQQDIRSSVESNAVTRPPYDVFVIESPLQGDSRSRDEPLRVEYGIRTGRVALTVETE
jgi:hypothetical protein